MNIDSITDITLFENRFWLQIMGDHSRFIFFSLPPTEAEYILIAQEFILLFDQLLEQSREELTPTDTNALNSNAFEAVCRLREFKVELLSMTLRTDLQSHLSPSVYNDMLNELEEYLFIINSLMNGQTPLLHPLHYHMLWLNDAIGHAAILSSSIDLIEKDLLDRTHQYEIQFHDLYYKSLALNGCQRTQLDHFPALEKLNEQSKNVITNFYEFLENLRDQRMDGKVLGTLTPLMADHMVREECYYQWKMALSTNNVRKPDCDPSRPRLDA